MYIENANQILKKSDSRHDNSRLVSAPHYQIQVTYCYICQVSGVGLLVSVDVCMRHC